MYVKARVSKSPVLAKDVTFNVKGEIKRIRAMQLPIHV